MPRALYTYIYIGEILGGIHIDVGPTGESQILIRIAFNAQAKLGQTSWLTNK